jgi:cytochrome c oxidase subunit II
MKVAKTVRIALLFLLAITVPALAACGSSTPAQGSVSGGSGKVVNAQASKWAWTLDQTEFEAGKPIKFQLTDKDGYHGFSIEGTEINTAINTGDKKEVTWTPDKPGEYTIRCTQVCGTGHETMATKITVK